ncbi:type 1 glutamine amidotransferase domain-containing protein [Pseudoalteromonas rubra]|uniref:type 1 glutamine amidotransferase domain-containing protein n=1 Tax=Pseudoalteromonas rubra TaxID=43658 RepID=UPI001F0C0B69|nr:type 1 glutamine amidotransferase domain-containing protein [Pseudoalteromonas rubra]
MMKRPLIVASLWSLVSAGAINSAIAADEPHVLMVLSSYGKQVDGKTTQPGFEFDELSKAYQVFSDNGIQVTLASPAGGQPLADEYNKDKSYNQAFLNNPQALSALSDTVKLASLNGQSFDGVFIVGGKGPMFDLHQDNELQRLIREIYEQQGVVGAVCHGPAALVDVKLSNGDYLVDGRRVNGFTNLEETAFGKKWRPQFEFLLEDKLKERGGLFEQDGLMLNQVTIDGRLITGQNPFSTADTAVAMVRALGIEEVSEPVYKDDQSVKLAELLFRDKAAAVAQFNKSPDTYDVQMLAMLGVYQAKFATTQLQLHHAIELMTFVQSQFNHPMIELTIAKAHVRQNNQAEAKSSLLRAQKAYPDNAKIKAMLATL